MELQHFGHSAHPLVFNERGIYGFDCLGCRQPIVGRNYSCIKCKTDTLLYTLHKSCAELPLGLNHPLHSKHPLILCDEWIYRDDEEFSKCKVCKEYRNQYIYRCSNCNFNLHITCASLPHTMEVEFHNHPLTTIGKSITFTCDLCGKEGKAIPYLCNTCGFWIHRSCAFFPRKMKVVRHKHPLNPIRSLEVHQSDSPFCQLCFQKTNTHYGLYCCSTCNFLAHLDCATNWKNMDNINLLGLKDDETTKSKTMMKNEDTKLDQSVDSEAYKAKKNQCGGGRN